ncbi:lysosome membrane protein 2 [Biomphalaria glabrata]|nr:lysosome membrane protein 2-like [Biomphalaria glabrata]
MSDTDLEQKSVSYDDAVDGTMVAEDLPIYVESTSEPYDPGAMSTYSESQTTSQHEANATTEQETEIDDPEGARNIVDPDVDTRPASVIEAIAAMRRSIIMPDIDPETRANQEVIHTRYGSCDIHQCGRVYLIVERRNCCDRLQDFVRSPKCPSVSGVVALFLGCVVLLLYAAAIHGVEVDIRQRMILRPNDSVWENPNGDIILRVFYFNVTNWMDVFQHDARPIMEEIGPFVYKGTETRHGLKWATKNESVCYADTFVYQFDRNLSVASEGVDILTVDLEALPRGQTNVSTRSTLGTRTVHTLMNDVVRRYSIEELETEFNIFSSLDYYPMDVDNQTVNIKNGSETFRLCVESGSTNLSRFNNIYSWNNKENLDYWSTKEANQIYGRDGTSFLPFVSSSSRLVIFDPRMYRKFFLEYKEVTSSYGIDIHRYIIPDSEFSNDTQHAYSNDTVEGDFENQTAHFLGLQQAADGNSADESARTVAELREDEPLTRSNGNGYCTPDCVPSGLYSIRTVKDNQPLFLSLPHFLGADPYYTNQTLGMKPDESKHRPGFDVHPLTGRVFRQLRRHQLVVLIDLIDTKYYIPTYWIEYDLTASKEIIDEAYWFSFKYYALHVLMYFLLAIAGLCLIHVIMAAAKKCCTLDCCQSRYQDLRPRAPCCCHCCTPFYRRFTYFMFRIGADD